MAPLVTPSIHQKARTNHLTLNKLVRTHLEPRTRREAYALSACLAVTKHRPWAASRMYNHPEVDRIWVHLRVAPHRGASWGTQHQAWILRPGIPYSEARFGTRPWPSDVVPFCVCFGFVVGDLKVHGQL